MQVLVKNTKLLAQSLLLKNSVMISAETRDFMEVRQREEDGDTKNILFPKGANPLQM